MLLFFKTTIERKPIVYQGIHRGYVYQRKQSFRTWRKLRKKYEQWVSGLHSC